MSFLYHSVHFTAHKMKVLPHSVVRCRCSVDKLRAVLSLKYCNDDDGVCSSLTDSKVRPTWLLDGITWRDDVSPGLQVHMQLFASVTAKRTQSRVL